MLAYVLLAYVLFKANTILLGLDRVNSLISCILIHSVNYSTHSQIYVLLLTYISVFKTLLESLIQKPVWNRQEQVWFWC